MSQSIPLAHRLRPQTLDKIVGQRHLIGEGMPVYEMIMQGRLRSMIFWGPPGIGKTTLARVVAESTGRRLYDLSAVSAGVKDIKHIMSGLNTTIDAPIVFIDEIHRFTTTQQDVLLHAVEEGGIICIGATTENPGYCINKALISRCHVYRLHPLATEDMYLVINRAAQELDITEPVSQEVCDVLVAYADGDVRRLLNACEAVWSRYVYTTPSVEVIQNILQSKQVMYDATGESHYDTISAFIKSMRGGDVNATVHYLARMIRAGEDPLFICRRMVIFASEDVGNAAPTALVLAHATMQAVDMIGMPESRIMMAQCAVYLAKAKKSTASYDAIERALTDIDNAPLDPIPLHLRNATNSVARAEQYGVGHVRYPWKNKESVHESQSYLPDNLKSAQYYHDDISV